MTPKGTQNSVRVKTLKLSRNSLEFTIRDGQASKTPVKSAVLNNSETVKSNPAGDEFTHRVIVEQECRLQLSLLPAYCPTSLLSPGKWPKARTQREIEVEVVVGMGGVKLHTQVRAAAAERPKVHTVQYGVSVTSLT